MDDRDATGRCYTRLEPPDLCVGVFAGDVDADEMRHMFRELRRFAEGKNYVLTLSDLSRIQSISSGARAAAAAEGRMSNVRGSAIVGGSFYFRVIARLVTTAVNLLNNADNPLRFFSTEAEARRWLDERRAELRREPTRDD